MIKYFKYKEGIEDNVVKSITFHRFTDEVTRLGNNVVRVEASEEAILEWLSVQNCYPVELTDEEVKVVLGPIMEEAKQLALDAITVTTASGKVFDGRDKDQVRMLSAIQASTLLGHTSAQWKLADNSIATVTLDELREAHALAIQAVGNIILGGN